MGTTASGAIDVSEHLQKTYAASDSAVLQIIRGCEHLTVPGGTTSVAIEAHDASHPSPSTPPSASAVGQGQAGGGRVIQPIGGNPRNGCLPSYNFAVANRTVLFCEAQASQAWHRCGDGGLVQRWVRLPNGQSRLADLIPPGQNGYYYFDPLLGGTGPQDVTVRCYNASPVDGLDAQTPLFPAGHAHTDRVDMPDTGSSYGRHNLIYPDDVR